MLQLNEFIQPKIISSLENTMTPEDYNSDCDFPSKKFWKRAKSVRPNGRLSFAAETKLRVELLTRLWKIAKKDRKEICRKNVAVQEMQSVVTPEPKTGPKSAQPSWGIHEPGLSNRRLLFAFFFYRPRQGNTRDFPPLLCTVQGAVQNEVLTFRNLTLYSSLWIDKIM